MSRKLVTWNVTHYGDKFNLVVIDAPIRSHPNAIVIVPISSQEADLLASVTNLMVLTGTATVALFRTGYAACAWRKGK